MQNEKKVIIAGGGFGGVKTALELAKIKMGNIKITLISDKSYFEYKPSLYRIITGRLPYAVCIPLRDIFYRKGVEVVEDKIVDINLKDRILFGESGTHYGFDFSVLALGSEVAYFDIPGLKKLSFCLKSIDDAVKLGRHLHKIFTAAAKGTAEEKLEDGHIVIIGGGATGTEIAGELAYFLQELSRKHGVDSSFVTIDLIEAGPRLVSYLTNDVSGAIHKRLRKLGVNIYLNRTIVKEDVETIFLKDMEMKVKTVIWTAGTRPNDFYKNAGSFEFDEKGKVLVDEFLQISPNVFVIGDAVSSPNSGLAQSALHQGGYVVKAIRRKMSGANHLLRYKPKSPAIALPIGHGWAALVAGPLKIYGKIGWWIRRLADLRFFLSLLPPIKAIKMFLSKRNICELCSICYPESQTGT